MYNRESASRGSASPRVIGFHEPDTGSCQYICIDDETRECALIDVVLEFDPASAKTRSKSAEWALKTIESENLKLVRILDTHPHADHMMASHWLHEHTGAPTAIGEKVKDIAEIWRELYNLPDAFDPQSHFDKLLSDGDSFKIGKLPVQVMLTPGHTLGSITYVVGDAAFVHDTFMQPDAGTSRADFPGGSASMLYDSLMQILSLPDDCRLFIGHDYGTEEREEPSWESSVSEQREENIHVGGGVSKEEYIKLREERDRTLDLPDRMLHVLQTNLRGGRLPDPEADGHRYFKIPANRF